MSVCRKILDRVFSFSANYRIAREAERWNLDCGPAAFLFGIPPIFAQWVLYLQGLDTFFSGSIAPDAVEDLAPYPPKDFPVYGRINAYSTRFLVEDSFVPEIRQALRKHFPVVLGDENHAVLVGHTGDGERGLLAENGEGERIVCTRRRQYGGETFHLLTNSPRFLRCLDGLRLNPPLPWISLPDADARLFLPRDESVWWHSYWRPFWQSLVLEEQNAFLNRHQARKHWMEFIEWFGLPGGQEHEYYPKMWPDAGLADK